MELKSCPFCGGPVKMTANGETLKARVVCDNCSVIMKGDFKGNKRVQELVAELMTEAWNRRDGV